MSSKNPLVSIIIPVYNGSNYLADAVDSALAQTFKNIEVLVIDDGSTDGGLTEKIARSYGRRIRYIKKRNGGVATALNLGIKKMKGEWFSWLSHDDIYLKDKIEKQVKYLNSHPKTKIIYTDYYLVDKNLKITGEMNVKPGKIRHMRLRLMSSYPLNGCTMLINKECFSKVGVFSPDLPTTQDYALWWDLAGTYSFDHLPIKSIKSRQHDGQGSNNPKHHKEADNLYVNYVNDLTVETIGTQNIYSAAEWFLALAMRYKSQNYSMAAINSIKHFWKNTKFPTLSHIYTNLLFLLPNRFCFSIYKDKFL